MSRLKIGVRLESLELPLRRGLQEVERMGASGVQVDAVGDLAPVRLSQTGRRELRHLLRSHNLEIAAVGCPLRRGLDVAENQELRIEHVKKVLTLSFDFGARLVIVEAGKVASEESAGLMFEALRTLGQFGDKTGAVLALTTGLDPADALARFLDRFDTGSLAANLDPAALLINGFDPISAVRSLNQRVRHVYARDARRAGESRNPGSAAGARRHRLDAVLGRPRGDRLSKLDHDRAKTGRRQAGGRLRGSGIPTAAWGVRVGQPSTPGSMSCIWRFGCFGGSPVVALRWVEDWFSGEWRSCVSFFREWFGPPQ